MNYNLTCVICKKDIEPDRDEHGHIYWHGGHNPAPIHDSGYCCHFAGCSHHYHLEQK